MEQSYAEGGEKKSEESRFADGTGSCLALPNCLSLPDLLWCQPCFSCSHPLCATLNHCSTHVPSCFFVVDCLFWWYFVLISLPRCFRICCLTVPWLRWEASKIYVVGRGERVWKGSKSLLLVPYLVLSLSFLKKGKEKVVVCMVWFKMGVPSRKNNPLNP